MLRWTVGSRRGEVGLEVGICFVVCCGLGCGLDAVVYGSSGMIMSQMGWEVVPGGWEVRMVLLTVPR